jgi:hypothetical protein
MICSVAMCARCETIAINRTPVHVFNYANSERHAEKLMMYNGTCGHAILSCANHYSASLIHAAPITVSFLSPGDRNECYLFPYLFFAMNNMLMHKRHEEPSVWPVHKGTNSSGTRTELHSTQGKQQMHEEARRKRYKDPLSVPGYAAHCTVHMLLHRSNSSVKEFVGTSQGVSHQWSQLGPLHMCVG